MAFPRASQALSRFTVLDLTRVRAGPTCVRQFADWGANVIKIDALLADGEEQMGGPRCGSDFQNLHRNRRAMTLNLKDPKGLEVFMRLAKQADVVGRELPTRRQGQARHRQSIRASSIAALRLQSAPHIVKCARI